MKGSVQYKDNTGKYYPVIYDKETKKHKWGTGFLSRREAEKELRNLLREYDDGKIRYGKSDTFESVYLDWIEMVAPEKYKSKHQMKTTESLISKHVLPIMGKIEIDQISTKDIQRIFYKMKVEKWIDDEDNPKKKKCIKVAPSPATKKKLYTPLDSIFKSALSWGLIDENPCENIELKSPTLKTPDTWTIDELQSFLTNDNVLKSDYYLYYLIAATTGISRSELCGLKWCDYHETYFVLDRGLDVYWNDTDMKNDFRRRKIELMEPVSQAINEHRKNQKKISSTIAICPDIVPWVVTDKFNHRVNPKTLSDNFRSLVLKTDLKYIPLKNLRHTFATLLINNNTNIKIVSEALGHSRTSTTQNYYQGAAENTMHRQAVIDLQGKVFPKPLEKPLEKAKKASS